MTEEGNSESAKPGSTEDWERFGIDAGQRSAWEELGFGPFAAALALADGFAPHFAAGYRHQLLKTASAWQRLGLDSEQGLEWHREGLAAKEAAARKSSSGEPASRPQ